MEYVRLASEVKRLHVSPKQFFPEKKFFKSNRVLIYASIHLKKNVAKRGYPLMYLLQILSGRV